MQKGSKVGIYGRIQPKRWTDKNGNRRFDIGIVVKRIDFLSPKAKSDAELAKTSKKSPKK